MLRNPTAFTTHKFNNIKLTNIFIIGVQERGEREKGHEKVFEEIIA